MSLLNDAMESCTMLDRRIVDDGYGSYVTVWTEGVHFDAAVTFDTSVEARIADKQGVTSLYTVTTNKTIILQYHDVFKRNGDGKVFRVTSDGDDKYTPNSAAINMRQVTAEEWVLNG